MNKLFISSVMSVAFLGFSALSTVSAAPTDAKLSSEIKSKFENTKMEKRQQTLRGVVKSVNKDRGTMVVTAEGQDWVLPITQGVNPKLGSDVSWTVTINCRFGSSSWQCNIDISI